MEFVNTLKFNPLSDWATRLHPQYVLWRQYAGNILLHADSKCATSDKNLDQLWRSAIILIWSNYFLLVTCNDVIARDAVWVKEKETWSDCYIILQLPPPNTGKVLFVKLLHFKQNSVVFLFLFLRHPSFCCPSVSTSPPWTALWCRPCLGLPGCWTNWRRKSCAIKTSSSNC